VTALTRSALLDLRIRVLRGLSVEPDAFERIAAALEEALDARAVPHDLDAKDLAYFIDSLESKREEAVRKEADAEREHEEALEEKDAEHEKAIDAVCEAALEDDGGGEEYEPEEWD